MLPWFLFQEHVPIVQRNRFRTLFLHTEIHLNPQDLAGKRGEPCVANSWISMICNYNRHKQLPKVQYLILTSIHSNTSSFLAFLFNIRFLSSSCIFAECWVAEPTFCDELTWPRANSIFCRRKKMKRRQIQHWAEIKSEYWEKIHYSTVKNRTRRY